MTQDPWDESTRKAKWAEMASAIERLAERVADPDDFSVLPGSSLAGELTFSREGLLKVFSGYNFQPLKFTDIPGRCQEN